MVKPELILALDVDSFDEAKRFVDALFPHVKMYKVGSQLFTAVGPQVVEYINKKGAGVFLDLKFFDIPNTIAHAVRAAARMKVKMLTLHILGDEEMLKEAGKAAREEAGKEGPAPLLIGVTVLTSKDATSSDVFTLAKIGLECGLDGVVCSAREAGFLREKLGKDFIIVTPGIRPDGVAHDDQKRTATVSEAAQAGSTYLVVGRPILKASDPLKAAKMFLSMLIAAGVFFAAPVHAETYHEFKLQPRHQSVTRKADLLQLRITELSRALNLSIEQVAKVKEVLLKSQEETGKVYKEAKESARNIKVKANDEIALVLNDAQKAQFRKIRKKYETVPRIEE